MASVRIVRVEDWMGVYVDGRLRVEGHSISDWEYCHLMRDLGIDAQEEYQELPDIIHMPATYEEVQRERGYEDAG